MQSEQFMRELIGVLRADDMPDATVKYYAKQFLKGHSSMNVDDPKAELREITRAYISDYLGKFAAHGQSGDFSWIMNHNPESNLVDMLREEGIEPDMHKTRFDDMYSRVPESSTERFRESVSEMGDVVVLDIASCWYGKDFGLQVAAENPHAEVHVFNPRTQGKFRPYLFKILGPDGNPILQEKTPFDVADQEGSVNRLYQRNGLDNIRYHLEGIGERDIERFAASGKRVVLYSRNVPTQPVELTSVLADAAATHDNVDVILMPLANMPVKAYHDDDTMQLINRYVAKLVGSQDSFETEEPDESARARLAIAMNLHYSLKAAEHVEGAGVYKVTERKAGFPFHKAPFIVSTVPPSQKHKLSPTERESQEVA